MRVVPSLRHHNRILDRDPDRRRPAGANRRQSAVDDGLARVVPVEVQVAAADFAETTRLLSWTEVMRAALEARDVNLQGGGLPNCTETGQVLSVRETHCFTG